MARTCTCTRTVQVLCSLLVLLRTVFVLPVVQPTGGIVHFARDCYTNGYFLSNQNLSAHQKGSRGLLLGCKSLVVMSIEYHCMEFPLGISRPVILNACYSFYSFYSHKFTGGKITGNFTRINHSLSPGPRAQYSYR